MLYFSMDFGEITLDSLIDTAAHSSAIPEADLIAPQSIIKRGTCSIFPNKGRKWRFRNPKKYRRTKIRSGDIEFHEIFIVMEKLPSPNIGLMFLQRNHTALDMRQGILNLPYFSMQLKTADHKYSNVMEPNLNPDDVTIPPNDHTVIPIQSQLYAENAVTGILQQNDLLHEESDVTFCAAIVTLNEWVLKIHVNIFTDQLTNWKKDCISQISQC